MVLGGRGFFYHSVPLWLGGSFQSPLSLGVHCVSDHLFMANNQRMSVRSPLPFGVHCVSDFRKSNVPFRMVTKSPLPFGVHCVSDRDIPVEVFF